MFEDEIYVIAALSLEKIGFSEGLSSDEGKILGLFFRDP